MFTLLGWKFEYEPYDLQGYIPDFILIGKDITGKNKEILVEVKPTIDIEGFDLLKIKKALGDRYSKEEVLLLGCTIMESGSEETQIGWIRGCTEDNAILNFFNGHFGFIGDYMSWADRITGLYEGAHFVYRYCYNDAINIWNNAGDKVQWSK